MQMMVNIAIDNAKDMYLYAIGANNSTLNALNSLIMLGVPFEKSVVLINQPSVKLLEEFRFRNRLPNAIKNIEKELDYALKTILKNNLGVDIKIEEEVQDDDESEDKDEYKVKELELTRENLLLNQIIKEENDYVNSKQMKHYLQVSENQKLSNLLKEINSKQIKERSEEEWKELVNLVYFQLKVMKEFKKAASIGENVKELAQVLGILREYPTKLEDQLTILNKQKSLFTIEEKLDETNTTNLVNDFIDFKEVASDIKIESTAKFDFEIPEFLNINPHIRTGLKSLQTIENTIFKKLFLYNSSIKHKLEQIIKEKFSDKIPKLSLKTERTSKQGDLVVLLREVATSIYTNTIYKKAIEKEMLSEEVLEISNDLGEIEFVSGIDLFLLKFQTKIKSLINFEQKRVALQIINKKYKDNISNENYNKLLETEKLNDLIELLSSYLIADKEYSELSFVQEIKDNENQFISRLNVNKNNNVVLSSTANLDEIELSKLKYYFKLLSNYSFDEQIKDNKINYTVSYDSGVNEDIIFEFLMYEGFTNGLKNQANNSVKFLPISVLKEVDNAYVEELKRFSDLKNLIELEEHIDNVVRKNTDSVKELWKYNNNTNSGIQTFKDELLKLKSKYSADKKIVMINNYQQNINGQHVDMIYVKKKDEKVPYYAKDNKDNLYKLIEDSELTNKAYYRKLGKSRIYNKVNTQEQALLNNSTTFAKITVTKITKDTFTTSVNLDRLLNKHKIIRIFLTSDKSQSGGAVE
jgi:hypothetical protein